MRDGHQPETQDGAVRLLGKAGGDEGASDRLLVNLAELPQEVSVVVTLASLDAPEGVGFAAVDGLSLSVATTDEQEVTRFGVPALGPETAVVVGEVYRREGGWRFRAVGQGYDTGLAGVASDHGITVDDAGGEDAVPERPPAPVVDEPVVDEPADIEPKAFRLTLVVPPGTKRGIGRGGFITSVHDAVDVFYRDVVQGLRPWTPPAPALPAHDAAVGEDQPEASDEAPGEPGQEAQ